MIKLALKGVLVLSLLLGPLGCSYLTSVSVSNVPADRNKKVRVSANRFIFLLMNFDNDDVNTLTEQLAQKCPQGKVKGILTKYESVVYFPIVVHQRRITAEGHCVE